MLKKGFRENEIHRWLEEMPQGRRVELGIGHDAAIVRAGPRVVLKVDQVVEGFHFEKNADAGIAGRKLMHRALSDCAAAGAQPRFALCSLAIPSRGWDQRRVQRFLAGFAGAGRKFGISLVGGDLSRASRDFVASATLVGELAGKRPAGNRSGALAGDDLLVTGRLGGSILGKHGSFRPRLAEGQRLREHFRVHAIMDLSDGMAADLPRMCRASGVGAEVEAAAIPISAAAKTLSKRSRRTPLWHALCDGEDYELLFAAAPGEAKRMLRDAKLRRAGLCRIGRIVAKQAIVLRSPEGLNLPWLEGGYEHVWV